jgi:membrane protein
MVGRRAQARPGARLRPRRQAAKSQPPGPLDRPSTLALGVLLGLGAVFADRWTGNGAKGGCARGGGEDCEDAPGPGSISWQGWKSVLKRTWREYSEDRVPTVAAGATFFVLLALFPALGVFVSLYGLFADVQAAREQIAGLAGILPEGGVRVLSEQIDRLASVPSSRLGLTFLVSLVLSVWSSNAGSKALIAGLNVAYEETERRNFLMLNLQSLGFTTGGLLLAVLGVAAVGAAPQVLGYLGLGGIPGLALLRWPVLLLVVVGVLSALYRYGPCRQHARWRWITPGGVFAALAWVAMSVGFSVYVGNFGHYDKTYGSLGAVVGFMTWIWLSLTVVLLGAELNAELEQQTCVDTTTGPPRPAGQRGSAVADGDRRGRS